MSQAAAGLHPDASAPRDGSALAVWGRRLVTVPVCLLLCAASLAAAPLWVPLAALIDASRSGTRAALRCGAFLTLYLLCEVAGIAAGGWLWLTRSRSRERFLAGNFALQCWWARSLFRGGARIFDFHLVVEGGELAAKRPLLFLSRHASVADTLLPILLVSIPFGTPMRYVLKRELLWDPCIDIVGNRLANYFVRRDSEQSEREIRGVAALVEDLGPGEGVLIYPEGTRFTPEKRRRVLAKLRDSADPLLYERAVGLEHLLPPRLGGTLALLEHNPGADAVFCAHVGFEGARSFRELWRGSMVGREMRVALWRVPCAEIPTTREERVAWLFEHWARIDRWIAGASADPG